MIIKLKQIATLIVWIFQNIVPLLISAGIIKPLSQRMMDVGKSMNTLINNIK